jgi:hypothetical protein
VREFGMCIGPPVVRIRAAMSGFGWPVSLNSTAIAGQLVRNNDYAF